eukprot:7020195-Prorocentrum_lima.AAC.1
MCIRDSPPAAPHTEGTAPSLGAPPPGRHADHGPPALHPRAHEGWGCSFTAASKPHTMPWSNQGAFMSKAGSPCGSHRATMLAEL